MQKAKTTFLYLAEDTKRGKLFAFLVLPFNTVLQNIGQSLKSK
jgi:hypothetical protein